MDERKLSKLLTEVQNGQRPVAEAVEILKSLPAEEMGFACLDHHRQLRTGRPEAIYGENKSGEQILAIVGSMLERGATVLATRVAEDKAALVCRTFPAVNHHPTARMLTANPLAADTDRVRGEILVVCAGTSDLPVAEEALLTARSLGQPVSMVADVGVAGVHRLLRRHDALRRASCLIVVAGMEGALPSVVGGLVERPVIAVPTSVGYGTGFGGIAALLGMLNSCAPGVAVVNIDNGFGAGCMAAAINRL